MLESDVKLYNALMESLESKTAISIRYRVDDTLYPVVIVSKLSNPYMGSQRSESLDGIVEIKEAWAVDIEGTFTIQYINGKQETLFCETESMFLKDWELIENATNH